MRRRFSNHSLQHGLDEPEHQRHVLIGVLYPQPGREGRVEREVEDRGPREPVQGWVARIPTDEARHVSVLGKEALAVVDEVDGQGRVLELGRHERADLGDLRLRRQVPGDVIAEGLEHLATAAVVGSKAKRSVMTV